MTQTSSARRFLGMNAAFSALNGILLLIAAGSLAPFLFTVPENWMPLVLRLLGVGLIGFAGLLIILARNRYVSKKAVREIVVLDALWVLGSVLLIVFLGNVFSTAGILVVTVVAMVVAFFAIAQFAAAAKITTPFPKANVTLQDGKLFATVKRTVNAPRDIVWSVMIDHPAYADVATNIAKVEVISGDGLGLKRRCFGPKGESWEETCDVFDPGHSYAFRIHTDAEDYPYPFKELTGRWTVEEREVGAEFGIETVATLKGNAASKWLFAALAKQQFNTILIDLADGWAERMEKETKQLT